MKGLPGILVAAGLGIAGAFCNWFYVHNQARNYQRVSFVGIKGDVAINPGDPLREEHLVRVDVPREYVGQLMNVAIPWEDRQTIIGLPATKSYRGREILLHDDVFTTPAARDPAEKLAEDEFTFPVVVDASTFIPEHFNPGDEVRFVVPSASPESPNPSGDTGSADPAPVRLAGPFRILAVGDRTSSYEVERAYNRGRRRENVITVALKMPFDAKALELFDLIQSAGGGGLRVVKSKPRE